MNDGLTIRRVEVSFVSPPPAQVIQRARGVSDVEIDGRVVRCLVCGSFQPFLEALRGHEVVSFESRPEPHGSNDSLPTRLSNQ
jgi:hypothetical protein